MIYITPLVSELLLFNPLLRVKVIAPQYHFFVLVIGKQFSLTTEIYIQQSCVPSISLHISKYYEECYKLKQNGASPRCGWGLLLLLFACLWLAACALSRLRTPLDVEYINLFAGANKKLMRMTTTDAMSVCAIKVQTAASKAARAWNFALVGCAGFHDHHATKWCAYIWCAAPHYAS